MRTATRVDNEPPAVLPGRLKFAGIALAAIAGAAVMVVEPGVARVLTPVFGGSIAVWAIVIATTILALVAGYAFGGYRADYVGGVRVAGCAAAIGVLLCATIPFLRIPFIQLTIDLATLSGATLCALALIAPTLFFLSQVSPALIRGLSQDGVSHVGTTAGGVYVVSTLGSLVGTLAAVWAVHLFPFAGRFHWYGPAGAAARARPAAFGRWHGVDSRRGDPRYYVNAEFGTARR